MAKMCDIEKKKECEPHALFFIEIYLCKSVNENSKTKKITRNDKILHAKMWLCSLHVVTKKTLVFIFQHKLRKNRISKIRHLERFNIFSVLANQLLWKIDMICFCLFCYHCDGIYYTSIIQNKKCFVSNNRIYRKKID